MRVYRGVTPGGVATVSKPVSVRTIRYYLPEFADTRRNVWYDTGSWAGSFIALIYIIRQAIGMAAIIRQIVIARLIHALVRF